jgi:hypothetical protein
MSTPPVRPLASQSAEPRPPAPVADGAARPTPSPRPSPTPRPPAAPPAAAAAEPAAAQPYGPGSAAPLPDGSAPDPAFTIKGNAGSMLFHPPSSPYYRRTKAEVWFRTPEDASAAGFTAYAPRRKASS